ncbi:MAG: insulinase family protein [Anaerolineae bacterium]|jgi:zinc protease|nr:insulinase family protein [Anaerolineae bacterium]MBT7072040.1 insulinase family protein [Anaerolineae bacterium]MBT7326610.1 insulinase family protein [Anaerolineae bacterium]
MTKLNSAFPGADDITRVVLKNGITVLCRTNFNSPSVVLSGYLSGGTLFDTKEKLGLADFTASCLMRGNEKRDFQNIYDALESVGAGFGFNARTHSVGFGGRSLAEDLPLLLEMLSDGLRQPTFADEHVERLRAQYLVGLALRAQDTGDMAEMVFDEILYAGHPYSLPDDGFPETIEAITCDDLIAFHREKYGPRDMVVSVVGAIDADAAVAQVEQMLGDWENPAQAVKPDLADMLPLDERTQRHHAIAGKSQADLMLGFLGPKRLDPDFMAASLGNSILGRFGLMGRIGDAVREKAGLAYYAYSSLSAGIGPGAWYIGAGVNPANLEKAIDLILKELENFIESGVTEEELLDNQTNYIGRLPLSLESNQGVAGALLNIERYDLGLDYYRNYPDLVRAVTRDDILAVARKYIEPARVAIATAGP